MKTKKNGNTNGNTTTVTPPPLTITKTKVIVRRARHAIPKVSEEQLDMLTKLITDAGFPNKMPPRTKGKLMQVIRRTFTMGFTSAGGQVLQ